MTAPYMKSSRSSHPPHSPHVLDPISNLRSHVRALFEPLPHAPGNGFDAEYNYIEKVSKGSEYNKAATSACLPANFMPKNRYANVLAPDATRVHLSQRNSSGSDYINASFVTDQYTKRIAYICAQGPTLNTVPDFWRMIWEQKTRAIAMLTREVEKNIPKCAHYWPDYGSVTFEHLTITSKEEASVIPGELIRRVFEIHNKDTDERRIVTQMQYMAWPDHGLPVSTKAFVILSDEVDRANEIGGGELPPIVHCSAGIGRSGTFCTVHSVLAMLRNHFTKHSSPPALNLVSLVLHFRKERPGMVQTKDQFMFCYMAVLEEYTRLMKLARAREHEKDERKKLDKGSHKSAKEGSSESSNESKGDKGDAHYEQAKTSNAATEKTTPAAAASPSATDAEEGDAPAPDADQI